MPQTAPKKVNPDGQKFIIQSADNDAVIGKYDTNGPVLIPESAGKFIIVELADDESLSDYPYNSGEGFQ